MYLKEELNEIAKVLKNNKNIYIISDDIYEYILYKNSEKFSTIAELDDENVDFMKELAQSHKYTEDFESKNTKFIDYQQRQDLLFNSRVTFFKKSIYLR